MARCGGIPAVDQTDQYIKKGKAHAIAWAFSQFKEGNLSAVVADETFPLISREDQVVRFEMTDEDGGIGVVL